MAPCHMDDYTCFLVSFLLFRNKKTRIATQCSKRTVCGNPGFARRSGNKPDETGLYCKNYCYFPFLDAVSLIMCTAKNVLSSFVIVTP